MSKFYQGVTDMIASHGHTVMAIFDHEGKAPDFAYTIGLFPKYGYELIMIGVGAKTALRIINDAVEALLPGELPIGVPIPDIANLPLMFRPCIPEKAAEYGVQAFEYYKRKDIPFLQLVVPDKEGRFPENAEYDHAYMDHRFPLLFSIPTH